MVLYASSWAFFLVTLKDNTKQKKESDMGQAKEPRLIENQYTHKSSRIQELISNHFEVKKSDVIVSKWSESERYIATLNISGFTILFWLDQSMLNAMIVGVSGVLPICHVNIATVVRAVKEAIEGAS